MAEYIDKWSVVNRLIDLENEFQQYKPFHGFEHAMYRKICEAESVIGKTPAADVAPVRHGRWVKRGCKWQCTQCKVLMSIDGTPKENLLNYCPNCGAKMMEG